MFRAEAYNIGGKSKIKNMGSKLDLITDDTALFFNSCNIKPKSMPKVTVIIELYKNSRNLYFFFHLSILLFIKASINNNIKTTMIVKDS